VASGLSERLHQRLERARAKLDTARRLLDAGDDEDAASRAYYAMYHAAHAALMPLKVAPKTHKGLSGMLSLHRIKPGHIGLDLYRAFVAARDQREYGDYGVASIVGGTPRGRRSRTPAGSSTQSTRCYAGRGIFSTRGPAATSSEIAHHQPSEAVKESSRILATGQHTEAPRHRGRQVRPMQLPLKQPILQSGRSVTSAAVEPCAGQPT
jgi:uncharacterized protein (UPF0332 family)